MLQSLSMQASPQHDGVVYAAELLSMALPPSSVTLAPSKWAGAPRFWNPVAWQAGCWHAGAAGIIAPLWPVSPEASRELAEALQIAPAGQYYEALVAWQEGASASGRPFSDWGAWTFMGLALE